MEKQFLNKKVFEYQRGVQVEGKPLESDNDEVRLKLSRFRWKVRREFNGMLRHQLFVCMMSLRIIARSFPHACPVKDLSFLICCMFHNLLKFLLNSLSCYVGVVVMAGLGC